MFLTQEQVVELTGSFVFAVDRHSRGTWQATCGGFTHFAYAQFVADAIRRVLADPKTDARVAMGLKSSTPGRRPGTSAINLNALSAARELLRAHGFSVKAANSHLTAKIAGASARTIARAVRDTVHVALRERAERSNPEDREFCLECLKVDAAPYAPLIGEILGSR